MPKLPVADDTPPPLFSNLYQDLTPNLPRKRKPLLSSGIVLGLIVHHEPDEENVWTLARRHTLTADHIGYHFVIEEGGVIYLTLEPTARGHHAYFERGDDLKKYPSRNPHYYDDNYLGVAFLGRDPSLKQIEALVQLTAAFLTPLGPSDTFKILGHNEVPGKHASLCPGSVLDMDYVRGEARRRLNRPAPDASWMRGYTSVADAAQATKNLLDSREKTLLKARDQIRSEMQILRASVNRLADLDTMISQELNK